MFAACTRGVCQHAELMPLHALQSCTRPAPAAAALSDDGPTPATAPPGPPAAAASAPAAVAASAYFLNSVYVGCVRLMPVTMTSPECLSSLSVSSPALPAKDCSHLDIFLCLLFLMSARRVEEVRVSGQGAVMIGLAVNVPAASGVLVLRLVEKTSTL